MRASCGRHDAKGALTFGMGLGQVSEYVPEVITYIQTIIDKGFAYGKPDPWC